MCRRALAPRKLRHSWVLPNASASLRSFSRNGPEVRKLFVHIDAPLGRRTQETEVEATGLEVLLMDAGWRLLVARGAAAVGSKRLRDRNGLASGDGGLFKVSQQFLRDYNQCQEAQEFGVPRFQVEVVVVWAWWAHRNGTGFRRRRRRATDQ